MRSIELQSWNRVGVTAAAIVVAGLLASSPVLVAQTAAEHWLGTWSTAEVGRPQTPPAAAPAPPPFMPNQCAPAPAAAPAFLHVNNQTLRQVVHTSIGGSKVRVVLSNAYGTAPVTIGAAHVAIRDKESAIRQGSGQPLSFSGKPAFTIPPGAVAYSDPVTLTVPPLSDVAIDLYLPGTTDTSAPTTMHTGAFQTSYVSETGNHVGVARLPVASTTQNWFYLYRVEVTAPESAGGLVVFGDSITDGTRSTPDTNNRWPDQLARRMLAPGSPVTMGIMNAAIAGNRVLSDAAFQSGINALARFDHNVLTQPGVTHVVFMEGINDIGGARENPAPSADEVIAGHKQLIDRAHSKGLKIYGATLTPFFGAAYYTDVGEAKRQAVNEWIRTGKAYDAVIDFDKAVRDPNDSRKMLTLYDSCDHLHPNDAGYKAMSDAIDLALFKTARTAARTSSSR